MWIWSEKDGLGYPEGRLRTWPLKHGVFWPIWVFPKIGVPQNGWFLMENPIKMGDLGVALFLETSIFMAPYIKGGENLNEFWYGKCVPDKLPSIFGWDIFTKKR